MEKNFKCRSCGSVLLLGPKVKRPSKDIKDKELCFERTTIYVCPVCSGEMKREGDQMIKIKKEATCSCGNKAVGKMTVAGVERFVCKYCKKFYQSLKKYDHTVDDMVGLRNRRD